MGILIKATKIGENGIAGFKAEGVTLVKDTDYVDPAPVVLPTLAYLLAHGYAIEVEE